jgi:DNA-binding GntR family transcriptional regulator
LAELTGSAVLARYVAEIAYRCALILFLYSRPHSADCAVSEHRDIVAALGEGDVQSACALMDHHLGAVANRARIVPPRPRERDLGRVLAPYVDSAVGA